ncbi:hypothetical protein IMY05_001G0175200 [Salix suchowensis]|nr:hypothetical protein IMY05_001G0175200 [Salix suchowensis]
MARNSHGLAFIWCCEDGLRPRAHGLGSDKIIPLVAEVFSPEHFTVSFRDRILRKFSTSINSIVLGFGLQKVRSD